MFKADLENVYQIFRDYNNTAKALGTDKIWEIKKNNSIYSVNIGNGTTVYYDIYKETENNDKSKTLFIHKYKEDSPALNEWIKVDFLGIDDKSCLIIAEVTLPKNISSNLYNTLSNFMLYNLKKLKYLIESSHKESNI